MFRRTTAINKIRSLKKRIKVVQGGTSSGKTYAIVPILIDRACKESNIKITVVAETLPAVKEGAMDIFKTIMQTTNRWNDSNWNAGSLTYTFTATKSRIQFKSFDTEGKAKASGKRDILFINEANHISFNIADALMIRSLETYIDYNPDNEFWVHTEVLPQPNSEFLLLTYSDNEGLPPETLEDLLIKKSKAFFNPNLPDDLLFKNGNIKNAYWSNWWKVYGLGQLGVLDGVIFTNWKIIQEIPLEASYKKSGLDFGFTNDPTTLIDKYIWNQIPIFDEALYQTGMINSEIAKVIKSDLKRIVIADSAEPKSIKEISNYGINIKGAEKGKDSINFGIQTLQQYDEFLVTARSFNLINELRKYSWDKDKTGKQLNTPIDAWNHCFEGNTLIETIYGLKKIKNIKEGDLVLTTNGYKKVIKKFNNGIKKVTQRTILFDTFSLSLTSTDEHNIKNNRRWKEVSKTEKEDILYLSKSFKEKYINFIKGKNTLVEGGKDYIGLYGSPKMAKYQKVIKSIIKTKTLIITIYKILKSYPHQNIKAITVENDLKKTKNGSITFIQKALKRLRIGINPKRGLNGIKTMLKNIILGQSISESLIARNAGRSLLKNRGKIDSVPITANLTKGENQELITRKDTVLNVGQNSSLINTQPKKVVSVNVDNVYECEVYDLMIEDCHEYFANGILVHNCIDGMRYIESDDVLKPKMKARSSSLS